MSEQLLESTNLHINPLDDELLMRIERCCMKLLEDILFTAKTPRHAIRMHRDRDLFYERKHLYGTQHHLNASITKICQLINSSRISHHVLSSGRGLLIGSLKFEQYGGLVDCSSAPIVINDCSRIIRFCSNARFVLVVEKDATFQKLIEEGFMKLFAPAILITGKGYPDIATRLLLKKLDSFPIFGLMDCDPHGIEIAMTYKYGGAGYNPESGDLSLPNFQWIGLSRTDVEKYPVPSHQHLPLTLAEKKKIDKLCQRAQRLGDHLLFNELMLMRKDGTKFELEAVSSIVDGFLSQRLIYSKLSALLHTHSK